MTATRFAFSSALMLILSAFVCNAQMASSDKYKVVNLLGPDYAVCVLRNQLTEEEIVRVAMSQQLSCINYAESVISCDHDAWTCDEVQSICSILNGQVIYSEACGGILVQSN